MVSEARSHDVHLERLAIASLSLLAALPAIMTFARNVPPLAAAIMALLVAICAWRDGSLPFMLERLKNFMLQPAGILLSGALIVMAASLLWTPAPERALRHLAHLVGSAIVIGVLIAAAPHRRLAQIRFLLPAGLALASFLVIVHFTMSAPVNAMLGATTDAYYLNRSAVAIALFSPIVLSLLWLQRRFLAAIALAGLALVAIALSISWSAKLAALAIMASTPLALAAPRLFHRMASAGMLLALFAAPLYVGHINALIPQSIHDAVGYGSMAIRGEIWREYAALYWQRPFFGFGLEASNVIPRTELAAALTENQIYLLSFGHPHNAVVQIWFEFGLFGALIAAALLGLFFRATSRLEGWRLSMATVTSIGVFAVASVSHGAWQAWWICLVGLVAYAFLLQIGQAGSLKTEKSG